MGDFLLSFIYFFSSLKKFIFRLLAVKTLCKKMVRDSITTANEHL